jgi:hypothetical protein
MIRAGTPPTIVFGGTSFVRADDRSASDGTPAEPTEYGEVIIADVRVDVALGHQKRCHLIVFTRTAAPGSLAGATIGFARTHVRMSRVSLPIRWVL